MTAYIVDSRVLNECFCELAIIPEIPRKVKDLSGALQGAAEAVAEAPAA